MYLKDLMGDANDLEMLERAFKTFKNTTDRPTLIIVDSHISYGAPNKQDTSAAHGELLGKEEIKLAKRHYGWPEDAKFLVPSKFRPWNYPFQLVNMSPDLMRYAG